MSAAAALELGLFAVAAVVVWAPRVFETHHRKNDALRRGVALLLLLTALVVDDARIALGAVTASLLVQTLGAESRTGRLFLGLATAARALSLGALVVGRAELALVASLLSLALRIGVAPLHVATSALALRHPELLVEMAGSAVVAVLVHVRFVIPEAPALAHDLAVPLVAWGTAATILGALTALAQTTLRGLWASSFAMHAGMLFAALGAAGRGHVAAAILVAVTLALALGGFGVVVEALEARTGPVSLTGLHGRVRAFPLLAAAFAVFAGAGVGLPGTAGFIADDLLLHALWEEGPLAAAITVVASATLAIALLRAFAAVFLGPASAVPRVPDLRPGERVVVALLFAALVVIGVAPQLIVGPCASLLP